MADPAEEEEEEEEVATVRCWETGRRPLIAPGGPPTIASRTLALAEEEEAVGIHPSTAGARRRLRPIWCRSAAAAVEEEAAEEEALRRAAGRRPASAADGPVRRRPAEEAVRALPSAEAAAEEEEEALRAPPSVAWAASSWARPPLSAPTPTTVTLVTEKFERRVVIVFLFSFPPVFPHFHQPISRFFHFTSPGSKS